MATTTNTQTHQTLATLLPILSPANSSTTTDGYEQVQQTYQDIFGIDSISKLNAPYVTSGQLLNDICAKILPTQTDTNTPHTHQLRQLIDTIQPIHNTVNTQNTIWNILLPEYHNNHTQLEWDRLLQVLRIIQYWITPSDHHSTSPNPSDHCKPSSNPNATTNINPLKSYTPPLAKCNNLVKTSFLTQQQHRSFRRIHFADSDIIRNRNCNRMREEDDVDHDGDSKAFSEDPEDDDAENTTTATHNNNNDNNNNNNAACASPPPNQILMSAKKAMSAMRGKNLDSAMLASGRKIAQNVMPRSRKTKKCTPGAGDKSKPKPAATNDGIMAQTNQKPKQKHKCKLTKRLSFVHEDEENDATGRDPEDVVSHSHQSHYGWKSRETSKEMNISMLSHVLQDQAQGTEGDRMCINDDTMCELKDQIEELEREVSNKNTTIDEYEKKLSQKSIQCRQIQQDATELQAKYQDVSMQCEAFKGETLGLQTATDTLQAELNNKASEYERKCSSFIEELSKKEHQIKEKESENMHRANELKTLRAKLEIANRQQSKMGQIELFQSKLLSITKDYQSLKNEVKFRLQKTSQEFVQTIQTIKHGLLEPAMIQNDTYMYEDTGNDDDDGDNLMTANEELKKNLMQLNLSYQQEKQLRKQLLEQIIDLKGTIRVFCRVRPKMKRKITEGAKDVERMATTCLDNERIVIDDETNKKEFSFDHVYQPGTQQDTVFEDVRPLIHSCVDGYNVCIFAYGQTGSGKTYTMEGAKGNRGVIYRSFDELFALKAKQNDAHNANDMRIYISCLEIYNEKIRDLLTCNNNKKDALKAKLSKCGKKVLVPGLSKVEVMDTAHVTNLLIHTAYKNRATGITNMNEHSSRSHALVFVDVVTKKTSSRLVLIDLAGSERVKKTGVSGAAFDEARAINKSLSALGNVINSLQTKQKHIPFRDSQLTYLLYDCLSGQSRALMFCNISCELFDVKESMNTLLFANRVRRVQLGEAQRNDNNHNNHNNNRNNNYNDWKQKMKKCKKDLEEKEKEINHLKMNNRNHQKEIAKLCSSIDAQNHKSSHHQQTRIEFNTLQKEHSRMVQDGHKKDKLIKKLSHEVTDYKHKLNQLKQKNHLQITKPFNRNKNPRKRKLPKDIEDNNNNHAPATIQAPQHKRRKMNHRNSNHSNHRNNGNKTKHIPSYQAPTRNFRAKTHQNRTMHTSTTRARANSLDNKENTSDHNNNNNSSNATQLQKSKTRVNRVNSMDSVVSVLSVNNNNNNNHKSTAKQQGNIDKPFTPSSAIEALKDGMANSDHVMMNGNHNRSHNHNNKKEKKMERKTNNKNVPITVSSLQIQSTTKNNNVWK